MRAKLHILIADDHPLVRIGLKQLLRADFPGAQVEEATSAREALEAVQKGVWNLILLDISMPDRSGLEILRDIKNFLPDTPVLILSGMGEDEFAVPAMKAGAVGYVAKAGPTDELRRAIRTALDGRQYVSATLAEKLALRLVTTGGRPAHEQLSEREFQVLRLIAAGKSAGDIATQLSLSVKTVSTYRTRLLEKMGFQSNAELTRYAIQHRLID